MTPSIGHVIHSTPPRENAAGADSLDRLRRGEPEALDELLRGYWQALVLYAGHLSEGELDAAEDLVQEAFMRLWERRSSWRPGSDPAAVLYTIVRNLALNERRTRRTRALILRRVTLPPAAPPTPGEELENGELARAIREAIEALPTRRREVFLLARFHGLSYAQIAETMAVSPQTVANHMSAALAALRARLGPLLDNSRIPS
jgi:RNA polymerase sigma-70 factor, ECF subfamily